MNSKSRTDACLPQDKSQTDSLNSLSRNELLAFCKECRLPPRILQNISKIFRASLNQALGAEEELFLPQFVECLIHLARELNPSQSTATNTHITHGSTPAIASPMASIVPAVLAGRENLPRRLQQLLALISKNLRSKVHYFNFTIPRNN